MPPSSTADACNVGLKLHDATIVEDVDLRARIGSYRGSSEASCRLGKPVPVFGIIKPALGFRQFPLRGPDSVCDQWSLVTMAWNMTRMLVLAGAI